jgi:N-acyl-phosphatidylethanolamine-hydrolysing phospholipase D
MFDDGPKSAPARAHRTARGFRNRYSAAAHGPSWDFLKFLWRMRTESVRGTQLPVVQPDVAALRTNRSLNRLVWIGHATFLLQLHGLNIITDPHLTRRASPLRLAGPPRFNRPGLNFRDLPQLDLALISHNHYDHLDERTVVRLAREHPHLQFVVPLGLKAWFARRRITRVLELDLWQAAPIRDARVHAVPVQHFSGRGATDRNRTLWCGFVIESRGRQVFFAGDTGYSRDFLDIAQRFAPMDLSLLPIGAYEPRDFMRAVHVDPEEAVQIHRDLQSRLSVAMHWGTFRLTLEPLDEPPRRLAQALRAAGIAAQDFRVLQHGETLPLSF